MYKLVDPFDGKIIGFSEIKVDDEPVVRNWVDSDGIRHFETRFSICEETSETPAQSFAAEDWLQSQGYSSLRMVALLDLEIKLAARSASSPKLIAVRSWVSSITEAFIQNPLPRHGWAPAPYSFEETMQEAVGSLGAQ